MDLDENRAANISNMVTQDERRSGVLDNVFMVKADNLCELHAATNPVTDFIITEPISTYSP